MQKALRAIQFVNGSILQKNACTLLRQRAVLWLLKRFLKISPYILRFMKTWNFLHTGMFLPTWIEYKN